MICDVHDERLGDYVDGTLPPGEAARVERHLAGCSRCRALAADFRAIRSTAQSLEGFVPPPRVWQHVAAATQAAGRRPSFGSSLFGWQPVAATAMAMVLSVGLWWIGSRLSTVVTSAQPSAMNAVLSAPLAAEVHYASAIARLEALTGSERAALDPAMIDVLDSGMTIVDAAIDQSRAALATQPDSAIAQESLFQALRTKVALLQDTLALVNEMRIEWPDGGMVSDLPSAETNGIRTP
jgi:anti-sigma factor RsiW